MRTRNAFHDSDGFQAHDGYEMDMSRAFVLYYRGGERFGDMFGIAAVWFFGGFWWHGMGNRLMMFGFRHAK